MACKLMSNVNKVASFSQLRNWTYAFKHSQQKRAWNSTPTPSWNWKTLRVSGFGLGNREKHGPRPDSNRRPVRRQACRLAYWAIRPSWPPRDKCLYDSQSIVSALAWKCLRKPCTQHQKIVDIFQSGAKWQKKRMFFSDRKYIEHYFDTQQNGDVWWCFFRD